MINFITNFEHHYEAKKNLIHINRKNLMIFIDDFCDFVRLIINRCCNKNKIMLFQHFICYQAKGLKDPRMLKILISYMALEFIFILPLYNDNLVNNSCIQLKLKLNLNHQPFT